MKRSNFGTLNWRDALRGLITAGIAAAVDVLLNQLIVGQINWNQVGIAAASGFLGYLKLNLLSGDKTK